MVGEAANGEEAVALTLRLRPDVITMDVLMPVLDGYAATERIMAECPTPIVGVTSLSLEDGTVLARMIEAGAVDVMSKAFSRAPKKWARMRLEFVHRVKAAAKVLFAGFPRGTWLPPRMGAKQRLPLPAASRTAAVHRRRGRLDEGPPALRTLLGGLEASLAAPVLVVQHITEGFTAWMADWLNGSIGCVVSVAQDGREGARGPGLPGAGRPAPAGVSGADPPAERGAARAEPAALGGCALPVGGAGLWAGCRRRGSHWDGG